MLKSEDKDFLLKNFVRWSGGMMPIECEHKVIEHFIITQASGLCHEKALGFLLWHNSEHFLGSTNDESLN